MMELFRKTVLCECGAEYEYVVQHPPIPMIVRGFYDDEGNPMGDDEAVCHCGRELQIPEESRKVGR